MVRYKKLGRVELGVTDVHRARRFYEEVVGLQYVQDGDLGEIYLRCDQEHHSVVLHPSSSAAGLRVAGFMLEDGSQFEPLLENLQRSGLKPVEVAAGNAAARHQQRAIRVFEPLVGAVIEFYTPEIDAERPFHATVARIQRLGHVVFNTPTAAEAVVFWRDVLNFRVSDQVGEMITFMRPWPSPWHHGIGIARFGVHSLHHLNYMVTEIDDIGRASARLRKVNAPIVFGPGRHPASDSVFLYFLDPDGLTMEYSFGMEAFSETCSREPRSLPVAPEWLDYWSSERDPRCFTTAGANAPAELAQSTNETRPLQFQSEI